MDSWAKVFDAEWVKTLVTALIASMFTAVIAEPLKGWVHNRSRRWQMRRMIIAEFCNNLLCFRALVESAKDASKIRDYEQPPDTKAELISLIKFSRLRQAEQEFTLFYAIPEHEWIVNTSRKIERLISEDKLVSTEADIQIALGRQKLNTGWVTRHIAYLNSPPVLRKEIRRTAVAGMLIDWRRLWATAALLNDRYEESTNSNPPLD